MIPESYHLVPDVCLNCAHCFTKCEYESSAEFYCTKDQLVRPPCGSFAMGESSVQTEEYEKAIDELSKMTDKKEKSKFYDEKVLAPSTTYRNHWNNWAEAHTVASNGTCDYFEKKKGKKNG